MNLLLYLQLEPNLEASSSSTNGCLSMSEQAMAKHASSSCFEVAAGDFFEIKNDFRANVKFSANKYILRVKDIPSCRMMTTANVEEISLAPGSYLFYDDGVTIEKYSYLLMLRSSFPV